tara:strand:- start:240 stop:848 length:609 start_codon:yes stop_codon:yes gene_type:complete
MTFGLVKHNNNSISAITSPGNLTQGKMTLLQTQTASNSSSIDFTSNIDSTYPIYIFKFINIHSSATSYFQVNFRDGGSSFDATKTSTGFYAQHKEDDSETNFAYAGGVAQSTGIQRLTTGELDSSNADDNLNGTLHLFNPSSTTFVKMYLSNINYSNNSPASENSFIGGYCNTTTAIDGVQFTMSSGNIATGTFKLYGIKGS